ncbi:hypothetical protein BH09MYX1_BH09MYX1_38780 [soil metagenome]
MRASLLVALALSATLLACSKGPSAAEIDALSVEVKTANAELAAKYPHSTEHEAWTLSIAGQATALDLDFARLDALATTHVRTSSPVRTRDTAAVLDYRGVLLSALLDLAHGDPSAKVLTFVASDGFISTVDATAARKYPIMLAVELEGKPITRADGGPVLLIFPETEFADVRAKYHEVSWCFYASYMIVGREPLRVDVDGPVIGEQRLADLPQTSSEAIVKYRFGWPSAPVITRGPRLRDVLASAGVKVERTSRVRIFGKERATSANDWVLGGAEILDCDAFLATSWGPDRSVIPAPMGGPLALVSPPACHLPDDHWPMFVSAIRVEK